MPTPSATWARAAEGCERVYAGLLGLGHAGGLCAGEPCTTTCCLSPTNPDTDGDGVNDGDEMLNLATLIDTDGDTIKDSFDRDDDNDGVFTFLEYYDLDGSGNFQFNWAVPKSYASSCRTMAVRLVGPGLNITPTPVGFVASRRYQFANYSIKR